MCFLASSIVYGKVKIDKTGEFNNVAPNAGLSATVVHPKKLDIVLMTDYTGTKKSTLLNDVNSTIVKLFNKNVDAQLHIEDSNNTIRTGEAYYGQEYDGSPAIIDEYSGILNGGTSNTTKVNIEYSSSTAYKRKLTTGYGTVIWNNNDTVSFAWNNSDDYVNHVGEAPTGGGILWDGSLGKVKQIGVSKHAVYILTTDNRLFMSGNAMQMAASFPNSWSRQDSPYTGMRQVLIGVKDIKSNYNGIAALMMDETVKYSGNIGAVKQYGDYGMVDYEKVMSVETDISSSVFMYSQESFVVTKGFVTLPGMNGITRIQIGQLSVIGMNDNTGQVYGIGFNQGQFGWTDPYYMPWTGPYNYNKYVYLPQQPTARLIPMLDARKIKDLYMYGVYTKVIEKDNSIWKLKGGGFTTRTYWQYMYSWCDHVFHSIEPGSYTKVGNLASDELFEIDMIPQFTRTKSVSETTEYRTFSGYVWFNDQLEHHDFRFGDTTALTVRKDGTAYYKYYSNVGIVTTREVPQYYNGIVPLQALNTEDVDGKGYRQGADKLVIYISDNTNTDYLSNTFGGYYPFTGLTQSYLSFLSQNNFGAYVVTPSSILDYVESKFSKQEISLRQVVNSSQDGRIYDTGNYAQALADILAKYSNNEENLNNYVIVDEDIVKYSTQFIDREKDIKNDERWMYTHNPSVFKNNSGTIDTNNLWMDNPITAFTKVGEYITTYQAQDNPTQNKNFDNYNLWSNQTEQLKIIAHRRPIANFTAKIPRAILTPINVAINFNNGNGISTSYNSLCNIQSNSNGTVSLNGTSGGATNQASATISINVPEGVTNAQLKLSLTGSLFSFKLDGGLIETRNDFSIPITAGIHTLTLDTQYNPSYRDSDGDRYPAEYGYFKLNNLQLTYDTHTWVNGSAADYINGQANITYNNTSYDIDHTDVNDFQRTLNVYPDKGIQKEEWKWIDVTPGNNTATWQSGKLIKYTKNRVYQLSLRVQDVEGAWSDPYIVTIGDNILEKNNPPIARFQLQKLAMTKNEVNIITDLSYDPDMDTLAEWRWRLLDGNGILIRDYGGTKPNLSTLDKGIYKLELSVRDNPVIPPTMWSDSFSLDFEITDNLKLTASLTPNPSKRGQKVTITGVTDGFAKDLTFYFPFDITSLDDKTIFPIYKAITVEEHHVDSIDYYLPLNTPYTIDNNGNRLRAPYIITVVASKDGGETKSVDLELDVQGNIYSGIKTELK